jgi:hypothetical protein
VLEAGTYSSTAVGPGITFSVDEGWAVARAPVRDVGFDLAAKAGGHILGFTHFDGDVFVEDCYVPDEPMDDLYDAERAMGSWLADPENQTTVDATVEGFWEHLGANPHLQIGDLTEVRISGFSGLQADLTATVAEDCFPRETNLWHLPAFGTWMLKDGAQARYTALDVDGTLVIVAAESAPGISDHGAHLERDDALLENLRITLPEAASEG